MRVLLAVVLACSACKSSAEASRHAWEKALARPGPAQPPTPGSGHGAARGTGDRDGWQALSQFAADAGDLLAGGATTVNLPRLAERLCVDVPEALKDDPGLDAVGCEPRRLLVVRGHELQLELGRASTIGASASALSDQASAELVRDTLQRLRGVCLEPWTPAPRSADNALEEFHTCPTATGAMLAVGRRPTDLNSGQWQFSLAVLGPG